MVSHDRGDGSQGYLLFLKVALWVSKVAVDGDVLVINYRKEISCQR